jgi:outer membrane immunogenic protein
MRRILLITAIVAVAATGARAADLGVGIPTKAPVAIDPATSWTGFYVGVNAGYGWSDRSADFSANDPMSKLLFGIADGTGANTPLRPAKMDQKGGLGGAQAGYNWQLDRKWLVGIEADIDAADLSGSGSAQNVMPDLFPPVPPVGTANLSRNVDWFGTLRARAGVLLTGDLLLFGTAGLAYGHVKTNATYAMSNSASFPWGGFSVNCIIGTPCFSGSSSRTAVGWAAGGGLEYALGSHWSVKGEYLYVDLGSDKVTLTATNVPGLVPSSFNANFRNAFSLARGGLNFRF